jgi:hypothetical protein
MIREDRPELSAGVVCEEGIRRTGSFVIRDSRNSIARTRTEMDKALFWIPAVIFHGMLGLAGVS